MSWLALQTLDFNMISQIKEGKLQAPNWLEHLAVGAQVEVNCLSVLDSLVEPMEGRPGLKAIIDDMTGTCRNHLKCCCCPALSISCATFHAAVLQLQSEQSFTKLNAEIVATLEPCLNMNCMGQSSHLRQHAKAVSLHAQQQHVQRLR